MAGILSKGIKLYAKSNAALAIDDFVEITSLQQIPSLQGEPERVDVTTLADASRRYIKGIIDYDDLEFNFLYEGSANHGETNDNYRNATLLSNTAASYADSIQWKLAFPDNSYFTWTGSCDAYMDSVGVNDPLTFTLAIHLSSEIVVHPSGTSGTVATPAASPAAGAVSANTKVALYSTTPQAIIHYTLDGSTPDESSAIYNDQITITQTTTIKAIAVKYGMADSSVGTFAYTVSG